MGDHAGSSAQRIRIGLTGLACAFLLVLLGSVVIRSGDDDSGRSEAEKIAVNAAEPAEPLAELGVAPGTTAEDVVEQQEEEAEAQAEAQAQAQQQMQAQEEANVQAKAQANSAAHPQ